MKTFFFFGDPIIIRTKLQHFLRLFWSSQNRKSVIFELAPRPRSAPGAPAQKLANILLCWRRRHLRSVCITMTHSFFDSHQNIHFFSDQALEKLIGDTKLKNCFIHHHLHHHSTFRTWLCPSSVTSKILNNFTILNKALLFNLLLLMMAIAKSKTFEDFTKVFLVFQVWVYLQKPTREPQGYQRFRTSGRGTIANQMKKEKTMSINKHVDDYDTIVIAQMSIRDWFRPCFRDSSGGRTTRKPN